MNIYIDFDGVIVDTETHLFDDYERQLQEGIIKNDIEYVSKLDWDKLLHESDLIEGSIEYLLDHKDSCVLTKVCTEKEYLAKKSFLEELGVFNKVIPVPIKSQKSDIVSPVNSLLIDDTVYNLDSWSLNGGEVYYFSFMSNNIDPWGNENTKYEMITNLQQLKSRTKK